MKRYKVQFRPEAKADLRTIYERVRDFSQSNRTARSFVDRIAETCERLGHMPLAGRLRDDLEPGLRTFPFEKRALILYRVSGDIVRVVNIFYGGRDYEALFGEPPDNTDDHGD